MPGEWREFRLGELAEVYDGPHATPAKTESGPIFLGISNLSSGRLDLSNTEHLSEEDFERWTRRVTPQAGDIVFSYETRLGEAALIPIGLRCCLGRRMGLLRARPGRADSRFLLYAYLGREFQETLRSRTVPGSTVDRIPLIDLPDFPIRVPARVEEQRAIAHILGTLDDKVELNRRMNETLEAMTRAIFKSWFVDFDPVRAKAEGRPPYGMDAAIVALFPDSFEDSTLGEIPKGWKVSKLAEVCELAYGKALKEDARQAGPVPVYGSNGQIGWHSQALVNGPGVVVGRKGNPGYVTWVPANFFAIDTTFYVVSRFAFGGMRYLFHQLSLLDLPALAADSAVPGLNRNIAYMTEVLIPSQGVIEAFEHSAEPVWRRVAANERESRALAAARDALLPKLVLAEIRVNDVNSTVEH
jgi:type I restriction enzyme, S subunit